MVGQKTAAAAAAAAANTKSAKMHRRSRSGCFTCRLRRKKCDEGKPTCKACKHLGLSCEYKRPVWWGNNDQRKRQKETIKAMIKKTKLTEKVAQMAPMSADTPPELSYSLPTSDTYSDTMDRDRSVSVDSQFSLEYDFNQASNISNGFAHFDPQIHPTQYAPSLVGSYPPYDVDVKTERQMYVNDIPTRRDSSISTFSTFQPPPTPHSTLPPLPHENWVHEEFYDSRRPSMSEESADFGFFDFNYGHATTRQAEIQVEECDRRLLDHFIDNVLRLIFPVLEVNQHGSARSEVILPALESNRCYLHCCLSISALHLKATRGLPGEQIDSDIMRHRYATISELCDALNRDTDHLQILEATLGMIFFQCSVGRPDDCLPDIPWHQHFQAASSLVCKLDLPRALTDMGHSTRAQPPFNMTLTAWIDILGSTMVGRAPQFADTYREKHLSSSSSGLCELMGCDDRVMYLISEIACLEALKLDGMDDIQLCDHIHALAHQVGLTEPGPNAVASPFSSNGTIRPRQLAKNMTAAFRLAARIYLCSLVPGFDRSSPSIIDLVNKLAECLEFIPAGPEGFDRSLVWPLLIAGANSTPGSAFRHSFRNRIESLGEHAEFGSFGRMVRLLQEVWNQTEERGQNVHWRDVMQQKGWDFLLI
ncbi:hypothetical protein GP486_007385 [Trichoglossum hirsutum]|uniref:Zn(2)-C6 fungal-type domain-containing protein n=1 Tax=Trichoglossum hirsutum TaxID=265104 RepID=A0A9P8L6W5_9PEZI|nr:hypothetical protein GP486_007385 [Trichoglossum hirsutum]